MGTSTTKRQLQAALALTLLACSGLTGCSDSQEQGATNAGTSKAAVASTHTANMAVITAFFILFILFIPKISGREDKCLVKLSRRGQLWLPAK